MLTSGSYDLYENGVNYANALVGLETFLVALKKFLGKAVLLVLYYLIFWPFALAFAFWLKYRRRFFQKEMRKALQEFHSSEEYLKHRKLITILHGMGPKLRKINSYNPTHVTPFLGYSLKHIKKMSSTLLTFTGWAESHFDHFNTPQFKTKNKKVEFKSEELLWKNRNQAYEYWM